MYQKKRSLILRAMIVALTTNIIIFLTITDRGYDFFSFYNVLGFLVLFILDYLVFLIENQFRKDPR